MQSITNSPAARSLPRNDTETTSRPSSPGGLGGFTSISIPTLEDIRTKFGTTYTVQEIQDKAKSFLDALSNFDTVRTQHSEELMALKLKELELSSTPSATNTASSATVLDSDATNDLENSIELSTVELDKARRDYLEKKIEESTVGLNNARLEFEKLFVKPINLPDTQKTALQFLQAAARDGSLTPENRHYTTPVNRTFGMSPEKIALARAESLLRSDFTASIFNVTDGFIAEQFYIDLPRLGPKIKFGDGRTALESIRLKENQQSGTDNLPVPGTRRQHNQLETEGLSVPETLKIMLVQQQYAMHSALIGNQEAMINGGNNHVFQYGEIIDTGDKLQVDARVTFSSRGLDLSAVEYNDNGSMIISKEYSDAGVACMHYTLTFDKDSVEKVRQFIINPESPQDAEKVKSGCLRTVNVHSLEMLNVLDMTKEGANQYSLPMTEFESCEYTNPKYADTQSRQVTPTGSPRNRSFSANTDAYSAPSHLLENRRGTMRPEDVRRARGQPLGDDDV